MLFSVSYRCHAARILAAAYSTLLLLSSPAQSTTYPRGYTVTIDLKNISDQPTAPLFDFERFYQTRPLSQLAFAPDDRSIFFTRSDGRVDNVFVMDQDNRAIRQLTGFDESVSRFLTDHRGRFLVLTMDTGGSENYDLYRFDLGTAELRRLTDAGRGDSSMACGLSADDQRLYYAQTRNGRREADLWQIDLGTGKVRKILAGNGGTLDCDGVSPDGRYLLYGELIGFDERHLGLLDLDSGEARLIDASPGINNIGGRFGGGQVYYLSALGSDRFRLWRYRIDSSTAQPVRLPFDNDIESFSLYANGRRGVISYRSGFGSRAQLFADGFATPLQTGLAADILIGAVFSDHNPALGIAFTEKADMPRRYYLLGKGEPALIYDSNRSGIENRYFAAVRSLRVPSFDGLQIPVHLFIPDGTSHTTPHPAIFVIHGGPDEHVDPLYLANIQFLANRGFVVIVPNVRGSTGFGRDFAARDDGDWGGGQVRDIAAVAEQLAPSGFIDAHSLFLIGESFGGFSVMSLLTRYPHPFRAAVDFFGFTELASFVESWPRFLRRHLAAEIGFDPRIDQQRNQAISPIYHVERIRIPLQIHQGANDSRVPRAQSDWLVHRLRSLGGTVEYYIYPDEGHGFTRFSNERLAWERVLAFLKRYSGHKVEVPAR